MPYSITSPGKPSTPDVKNSNRVDSNCNGQPLRNEKPVTEKNCYGADYRTENKIDNPLLFISESTNQQYKNAGRRNHNNTHIVIHIHPPFCPFPLQYMTCTFFILHEYLRRSCLYLEKEEIFGLS